MRHQSTNGRGELGLVWSADDSARQFELLSQGEFTQQLLDAQQAFITVDSNV